MKQCIKHNTHKQKDRAMAWAHQLALTCPEYESLMALIRDLLVQLMDSRKGTNGVSTDGVMLFDRGTFWVLPLVLTPFVRNQGRHPRVRALLLPRCEQRTGLGRERRRHDGLPAPDDLLPVVLHDAPHGPGHRGQQEHYYYYYNYYYYYYYYYYY